MTGTRHIYKHRRLLGSLALLVIITLESGHPSYGSFSYSKSPISKFTILTQSGSNSGPPTSTSLMTLQGSPTTNNDKWVIWLNWSSDYGPKYSLCTLELTL
jgi:hypothetical protein